MLKKLILKGDELKIFLPDSKTPFSGALIDFLKNGKSKGIIVIKEEEDDKEHNIEVYLKRIILDEFPHNSQWEKIEKVKEFHIFGIT